MQEHVRLVGLRTRQCFFVSFGVGSMCQRVFVLNMSVFDVFTFSTSSRMDIMFAELLFTKYPTKLNVIHVDFTEYHEDIPPLSEPWRGTGDAEQVACDATWHDSASNFVAGTPLWNLYLAHSARRTRRARGVSWHLSLY